jgi:hypothetical protein
MDSVKCPHCGKQVELSEAIIHELSAQVRDEESKKLKAEFEAERAKQQEEAEKRLRKEYELEAKEKTEELEEFKRKEKLLADKLVSLEEEREKNEEKIRIEASKKAEEDQALKLKEKDIQMDQIKRLAEDLRRANEDLKRKLEQGSQQMQGEALELNFEEKLKSTFPGDEFVPVPKGVEGGDIWQKVRFNGRTVGSIIWETKRTKAWSNGWLTKLKDDAAKISATEAIIATQVLPNDISNFDRKDGVWLTTYEHAINICRFVRFLITNVASAKSGANHTEEEWGKIRDYMMSEAFKHRMQAHFDAVNSLRDSLEAEKRATTLRWKKQESQISKLDMNTVNFYGELKSIVTNLPELTDIETPQIESGQEDEDETALF